MGRGSVSRPCDHVQPDAAHRMAGPDFAPSAAASRGTASIVSGQRPAKGQPGGRSASSGTVPGIVASRSPLRAPSLGRAREQAQRVGMPCGANTASVGPLSTTLPPYITSMRCTFCAITPRSCEISISAMPRSATRSAIRSRIWRWMVTSSAVVGSSAISRSGPQASAIAMVTRWRWPPENWCG